MVDTVAAPGVRQPGGTPQDVPEVHSATTASPSTGPQTNSPQPNSSRPSPETGPTADATFSPDSRKSADAEHAENVARELAGLYRELGFVQGSRTPDAAELQQINQKIAAVQTREQEFMRTHPRLFEGLKEFTDNSSVEGQTLRAQMEKDIKAIDYATRGMWNNEADLYALLKGRSAEDYPFLDKLFKKEFGESIDARMVRRLDSSELAYARSLVQGDKATVAAHELYRAMHGIGGDDEEGIQRILESLTPEERQRADHVYREQYKEGSLKDAFRANLSGDDLLVSEALLDSNIARARAAQIHRAAAKWSPDANAISQIVEGLSPKELDAVRAEFAKSDLYGANMDRYLMSRLSAGDGARVQALLKGDPVEGFLALMKREGDRWFRADAAGIKEAWNRLDENQQQQARERFAVREHKDLAAYAGTLKLSSGDSRTVSVLIKNGTLNDVDLILDAITGAGTNEEQLLGVLRGKTKAQIAELEAAYKAATNGRDLRADVMAELSGDQRFDAGMMFEGTPETVEQMLSQAKRRFEYERSGVFVGVVDFFTRSDDDLKADYEALQNLAEKMKTEGALSDPALQAELIKHAGRVAASSQAFRDSKNFVADTAANVAAGVAVVTVVAGAAVLTIATGGAGAPVLVVAVAAAGASFAARAAVKAALKGQGYGYEEIAVDGGMAAIDGATVIVAAGASRLGSFVGNATGATNQLGRVVGGRVAESTVRGAATAAGSSAFNAASATGLQEGNWQEGIGQGLLNMGENGAIAGAAAAPTGAVLGALAGKGLTPSRTETRVLVPAPTGPTPQPNQVWVALTDTVKVPRMPPDLSGIAGMIPGIIASNVTPTPPLGIKLPQETEEDNEARPQGVARRNKKPLDDTVEAETIEEEEAKSRTRNSTPSPVMTPVAPPPVGVITAPQQPSPVPAPRPPQAQPQPPTGSQVPAPGEQQPFEEHPPMTIPAVPENPIAGGTLPIDPIFIPPQEDGPRPAEPKGTTKTDQKKKEGESTVNFDREPVIEERRAASLLLEEEAPLRIVLPALRMVKLEERSARDIAAVEAKKGQAAAQKAKGHGGRRRAAVVTRGNNLLDEEAIPEAAQIEEEIVDAQDRTHEQAQELRQSQIFAMQTGLELSEPLSSSIEVRLDISIAEPQAESVAEGREIVELQTVALVQPEGNVIEEAVAEGIVDGLANGVATDLSLELAHPEAHDVAHSAAILLADAAQHGLTEAVRAALSSPLAERVPQQEVLDSAVVVRQTADNAQDLQAAQPEILELSHSESIAAVFADTMLADTALAQPLVIAVTQPDVQPVQLTIAVPPAVALTQGDSSALVNPRAAVEPERLAVPLGSLIAVTTPARIRSPLSQPAEIEIAAAKPPAQPIAAPQDVVAAQPVAQAATQAVVQPAPAAAAKPVEVSKPIEHWMNVPLGSLVFTPFAESLFQHNAGKFGAAMIPSIPLVQSDKFQVPQILATPSVNLTTVGATPAGTLRVPTADPVKSYDAYAQRAYAWPIFRLGQLWQELQAKPASAQPTESRAAIARREDPRQQISIAGIRLPEEAPVISPATAAQQRTDPRVSQRSQGASGVSPVKPDNLRAPRAESAAKEIPSFRAGSSRRNAAVERERRATAPRNVQRTARSERERQAIAAQDPNGKQTAKRPAAMAAGETRKSALERKRTQRQQQGWLRKRMEPSGERRKIVGKEAERERINEERERHRNGQIQVQVVLNGPRNK